MIETHDGEHSFNFDELLSYLLRDQKSREELAVANFHNPERQAREQQMANNYRHMYAAALHYRKKEDSQCLSG